MSRDTTSDHQRAGDAPRILVVDDDPQVLKITELMLRQLQYEVITAAGGEQAVARVDEEGGRIDLLLMDLTMPGMSGSEAFAEIRRRHPHLKVIYASGYQEDETADLTRAEGVVGFLQKPFELETLGSQVRRGLES